MTRPIGYTKESAYELATKRGMHPGSANAVMEFIAEVQQAAIQDAQRRALAAQAMTKLAKENEKLGLYNESENEHV